MGDRHARGFIGQARSTFERTLQILSTRLGPDDLGLIASLDGLANGSLADKNYPAARSYEEQILSISRAAFGPFNPAVAQSYGVLAGIAAAERHDVEAESLYTLAVTITKKAQNSPTFNLASRLDDLSSFYVQRLHYDKAEPLQRQSLSIYAKALGPTDPRVMRRRQDYVVLLRMIGMKCQGG